MVRIKIKIWMLVVGMFLCSSCDKKINTLSEFRSWFGDKKNGFIKVKHVDHLNLRVQLKPIELMMINDLDEKNMSQTKIDSIKKTYGNSLYFSMEVGYDDEIGEKAGNIENYDIQNYDQFANRVNELAFGMNSRVWLEANGKEIYPTLSHFERGYELGKKESILFAFPPVNEKEKIIFVFNDEIFGTGINRFAFDTKNIQQPELPIIN